MILVEYTKDKILDIFSNSEQDLRGINWSISDMKYITYKDVNQNLNKLAFELNIIERHYNGSILLRSVLLTFKPRSASNPSVRLVATQSINSIRTKTDLFAIHNAHMCRIDDVQIFAGQQFMSYSSMFVDDCRLMHYPTLSEITSESKFEVYRMFCNHDIGKAVVFYRKINTNSQTIHKVFDRRFGVLVIDKSDSHDHTRRIWMKKEFEGRLAGVDIYKFDATKNTYSFYYLKENPTQLVKMTLDLSYPRIWVSSDTNQPRNVTLYIKETEYYSRQNVTLNFEILKEGVLKLNKANFQRLPSLDHLEEGVVSQFDIEGTAIGFVNRKTYSVVEESDIIIQQPLEYLTNINLKNYKFSKIETSFDPIKKILTLMIPYPPQIIEYDLKGIIEKPETYYLNVDDFSILKIWKKDEFRYIICKSLYTKSSLEDNTYFLKIYKKSSVPEKTFVLPGNPQHQQSLIFFDQPMTIAYTDIYGIYLTIPNKAVRNQIVIYSMKMKDMNIPKFKVNHINVLSISYTRPADTDHLGFTPHYIIILSLDSDIDTVHVLQASLDSVTLAYEVTWHQASIPVPTVDSSQCVADVDHAGRVDVDCVIGSSGISDYWIVWSTNIDAMRFDDYSGMFIDKPVHGLSMYMRIW